MPKVKDKLVIQNNILIAEFMGGKPENAVKDNPIAYIFPFEFGHQETWDEGGFQGSGASSCWDIGDLQYHTSWDWLMPVVAKAQELSGQMISMSWHIDKQYEIVLSYINYYNSKK